MKKHISTMVFGCLGVCAGFTICFVFLVVPERGPSSAAPAHRSDLVALESASLQQAIEWRPYLRELHQRLSRSEPPPFEFGSRLSTNHGISEIGIEREGWLGGPYTFVVRSDGTFRYHGT